MQVLTTIYRAAVMAATLAIVIAGWRLYGPSEEQLKSLGRRAVEIADEALGRDEAATNETDPRLAALSVSDAPLSLPATAAEDGALATPPSAAHLLPVGETTDVPSSSQSMSSDDPQLRAVLARLEELGVREVQLEPWGSRGELYRFSCRVPWGGAASFARHVESVAEAPLAAAEAVAAKVDAWRLAE